MRVPVNERVKEAPAQALRAMFAGIGQLLLVTDRFRNRAPEGTPAEDTPDAAPAAPITETAAANPSATATAEAPAPVEEAAAEAAVETPAPAAEAAGADVTPDAAEAPAKPASELPLPGYDELTVPSLRARMRNLSEDQLTSLISYEQSHENRTEVIAMFQRRIAKLSEA